MSWCWAKSDAARWFLTLHYQTLFSPIESPCSRSTFPQYDIVRRENGSNNLHPHFPRNAETGPLGSSHSTKEEIKKKSGFFRSLFQATGKHHFPALFLSTLICDREKRWRQGLMYIAKGGYPIFIFNCHLTTLLMELQGLKRLFL